MSARTVDAHLTAAKSLSRWLERDGRAPGYTLETLAKFNEQADRRRVPPALTPEEAVKVIRTRSRPRGRGFDPPRACEAL